MITIIYPFRNRDSERITRSLKSLEQQVSKDFRVLFIDYGSNQETASKTKNVVEKFAFCQYIYSYNRKQPWSRAKALNIGVKMAETPFVFMADIDMIFHSNFVDKLHELKSNQKAIYFKVGFLGKEDSTKQKEFEDYKIVYSSAEGAAGLSLFPTKIIKELNGFDEFFHFWGAEDENIHMRFKNAGYTSEFYDAETLMLHQWHEIYRNYNMKLSAYLRLDGIVPINAQYNNKAGLLGQTVANKNGWGVIFTKEDYEKLQSPINEVEIITLKNDIDAIGNVLKNAYNKTVKLVFKEPSKTNKQKQFFKKLLGKKYVYWYTIRETNNVLLYQLVSQHRDNHYIYEISEDLKSITLTISL